MGSQREGQVHAIRRAYAASGINPSTVGLIECHATSTPVGDRTEIEALEECFGRAAGIQRSAPLPIGSVKGNIGHTRETAGVAGLVKAILALENQTIPPTGNFREASPRNPLARRLGRGVNRSAPWTTSSSGPRRAGVNALGSAGSTGT